MNRALPPRDRGYRNTDPVWPSRSAGVVSGTLGLVGRASNPPKRRTPPEVNPAARRNGNWRRSAFYRVIALAVLALSGCHGKAHLLADGPRQEPAYRMRLPACGFHQFLGGRAARPLEQFQDFGGRA